MTEDVLQAWFCWKTASARKARLHGWRLWHTYAIENDITIDHILSCKNPGLLGVDFVVSLDRQGVKDYRIKEAKLAVQEMLEPLRPDDIYAMRNNAQLNSILMSISSKVNRASRYHEI